MSKVGKFLSIEKEEFSMHHEGASHPTPPKQTDTPGGFKLSH